MIFKRPTTNTIAIDRANDGVIEAMARLIAEQLKNEILLPVGEAATTQPRSELTLGAFLGDASAVRKDELKIPRDLPYRILWTAHNDTDDNYKNQREYRYEILNNSVPTFRGPNMVRIPIANVDAQWAFYANAPALIGTAAEWMEKAFLFYSGPTIRTLLALPLIGYGDTLRITHGPWGATLPLAVLSANVNVI